MIDTELPLSALRRGNNPRRYFDKKKHDEMVASIRVRGILQPILARPTGDATAFEIVAGDRRYLAAREALGNDAKVPVFIRVMTDQEALEAAIDENDNREDASETEQADAAVRVLAACQGDKGEAAKRLAWSPSKLDRRLALAGLSDAVKTAVDERRIKIGHAELLAAVPADKQDKALDTIITSGIDVAKTRELLMRVTQSLASATFDKTECTTCPFNSASQRALFENHVDDGHCTNPGCYQLKSEAAADKAAKPAAKTATKAVETPAAKVEPEAAAPAPPAAKAPTGAPAPTPQVTAAKVIALASASRQEAWRAALIRAVEGDPDFAAAFDATLRDTWQVNKTFLMRFGKDELKFIAHECGLVDHMGAKAFAKLLELSGPKMIDGMLHAKGFNWAGRLPSAITLDGKYSPPPAAPAFSEKD